MAVAGVPEHAHCEICQQPVTVGQRLCDRPACKEKFDAAVKQKKRGMYVFIALIFAVLILSRLLGQF